MEKNKKKQSYCNNNGKPKAILKSERVALNFKSYLWCGNYNKKICR